MIRGFRKVALTVGAVALFSAQVVVAAPPSHSTGIDPLVALSALGTAQSKAAVCASGSSSTAAGAAAASAAAAAQGQGNAAPCVLPVTGPPAGSPVQQTALAKTAKSSGMLMAFAGVALIAALFAAFAAGSKGGDRAPVSPA